jgi:acyl-CoA synthetase (NDP forming)
VHEQLITRGFKGELFPVNPRHDMVRGLPAFPDIESLPATPDLVVVATPVETVLGIVRACATRGVGAGTILASGFADAGTEGAALQKQVGAAAAAGNMVLCGPNCYGVANLLDGVAASSVPLPVELRSGGLAFVLQSGALSHGIIDFAIRRGLGVGYFMTAGNEAGLDIGDYLEAVAGDRRIASVALYLEAVRRPRVLLEALARLAAAGIAVSVLKSGRSEAGRQATAGHTGAVADDDRVWSALLASVGATRVYDLGELAEAGALGLSLPTRDRRAPFFMSFSGAATAIIADLAVDCALPLVQLRSETAGALAAALPEAARAVNPLDLTGYIADQPDAITGVTAAICTSRPPMMPVMVLNSPAATSLVDRELYCRAVEAVAAGAADGGTQIPPGDDACGVSSPAIALVATMLPGDVDPEVLATCRRRGLPVIAGMRQVVSILAAREAGLTANRRWNEAVRASSVDAQVVSRVAGWLDEIDGVLIGEGRAKDLLSLCGIAIPAHEEAAGLPQAVEAARRVGYPLALKVDDALIPHKARVGCLALDLRNEAALTEAFARIAGNAAMVVGERPVRAYVVEEQTGAGTDLFAGVIRNDDLDPVLVVGIGGAIVEQAVSVAGARLPLDRKSAENLLERSGLATSLRAARRDGAALDAMVAVLQALSDLALALGPRLRAIDVNPLRVLPDGGRPIVALDALVELRPDNQDDT